MEGYELGEEIYRGSKTIVYRAVRVKDKCPVIIKALRKEKSTAEATLHLRREFEINQAAMRVGGVLEAYRLVTGDRSALVLEDFGGQPLRSLLPFGDLGLFLDIAVQLADILGGLHREGIVHRDVKPANILVNPNNGQVKIGDFGVAFAPGHEDQHYILSGTPAYMAPEQTGRFNRTMDYRADFYSLGVTLYEVLVGELPFTCTESLELAHAHAARVPEPPHVRKNGIPRTVSLIIMKLLSKTLEDRYQSGAGLKADLEICRKHWAAEGKIEDFVLGNRDVPAQFQISQKMYGRRRELDELTAAFTRVCRGSVEFVFICGPAGAGKSSLVREMFARLLGNNAYFLSGKFDQLDNPPFGAVIQCFDELMRRLAAESEEQLASWRNMIVHTLGATRRLIGQVVPSMNFILDVEKTEPPLPVAEEQKLLDLAFAGLLEIFSREERPLVLFFDDLQWADPASIRWLRNIASDRSLNRLLVIGAYRDEELEGNELFKMLKGFCENGGKSLHLSLESFDADSLKEMLADTFYCGETDALSLAKLVRAKTQGNPFFVKQFLTALQRRNAFEYMPQRGWRWDIDKIRQMEITDNAVELIRQKERNLPKDVRHLLSLAACLGNRFSYSLLEKVARKCLGVEVSIDQSIRQAIDEGMLISSLAATGRETEYRFAHDQIQKSFYSLASESQKLEQHAIIGRLLWGDVPVEKLGKEIYTIAYHLNFAAKLVENVEERLQLARLDLLTGKKARGDTAYITAAAYFEKGLQFLPKNAWERDYQLAFSLHREKAECEHLSGNFSEAERFFDLLLKHAKTKLEMAEIYESKVLLYTSAGKTMLAVKNGVAALRLLGVRIPERKLWIKLAALLEIIRAWWIVHRRPVDKFLELPEIDDPEHRATVRIMGNTAVPAFMGDPESFVLLCSKVLVFTKRYGNCEFSPFSYCGFTWLIATIFQDYYRSYHFGKLALKLDEKYDCARFKVKVYYIFGEVVNHHYHNHLRTSLPYLENAYRYGIEYGDLTWAGYACVDIVLTSLVAGLPLGEVICRARDYFDFVERTKDPVSCNAFRTSLQTALAYRGATRSPWSLSDDNIDENQLARDILAGDNLTIRALYFSLKMELCIVFHRCEQALEFAVATEKIAGSMKGELSYVQYVFYYALTLAAVCSKAGIRKHGKYLRKIDCFRKQMKIWADNAPVNFLHKLLLIEAEVARVRGKHRRAEKLYERAICKAQNNDYLNDAGLACELAGRFYFDRGILRFAEAYMREAYQYYRCWGSIAKTRELAVKYLAIFGRRENAKGVLSDGKSLTRTFWTVERDPAFLDFAAILKACRIIAGEVELPALLDKFMLLVMESAGAQKAFFIAAKKGQLEVVVRRMVEGEDKSKVNPVNVDLRLDLSPAIVRYVDRTLESVVINDALRHEKFRSCPYIQSLHPKSILCMPVLEQGRMLGIVYLENNVATYAFNEDRVEILQILSAQAAIALENAGLYQKMSLLNEGLKKEARERQKALDALRENEERLNLLLRQVPALLWTTDSELCLTSTAGQAMKTLGLQPGDLMGTALVDYLGDDNPNFLPVASHLRALNGETAKLEHRLRGHLFDGCVEPLWDADREIIGTVGVALDITERRELEREVLDIGDREQQRISRDLHDGLGQYLLSIGWGARRVESQLRRLGLEKEAKKAGDLAQMADQALEQTRRMIKNLFPVELEQQGLSAALQQLAQNLKSACQITCNFAGEENFAATPTTENHLYRIAQEAVNNAIKHGKAKNITIELICDNSMSLLRIRDDGRGMPENTTVPGMGLKSMKYRANLLAATLCVQQSEDGGTLVECRLPLESLDD